MTSKSITDEELLDLINRGELVLRDIDSAHPILVNRGRVVQPYLNEQGGKQRIYGGKRWRWKVRYNGRRRNVVCAKLVVMFVERRTIPEGSVVHHGRLGSQYDGYINLTVVTDADHKSIHYGSTNDPF